VEEKMSIEKKTPNLARKTKEKNGKGIKGAQ
jgi:hypothetical protein